MHKIVNHNEIDIFHTSSRVIACGYSGSGKSYLISKLIDKYLHKFSAIKVCGVDALENISSDKITYHNDDNVIYDPFKDDLLQKDTLIILDDCLQNRDYTRVALNIFIRGRHKHISCIYVVQNIYHQDKMFRSIALNANYVILLRMRDSRQIRTFASSFLDRSKISKFLEVYGKYVANKKYGHLLIDFGKYNTSPLLIRSNIAGEGKEICIYI